MNRTQRRNEISTRAEVVADLLRADGIQPDLRAMFCSSNEQGFWFTLATSRREVGKLVDALWEKWPDVEAVRVTRGEGEIYLRVDFTCSQVLRCDA